MLYLTPRNYTYQSMHFLCWFPVFRCCQVAAETHSVNKAYEMYVFMQINEVDTQHQTQFVDRTCRMSHVVACHSTTSCKPGAKRAPKERSSSSWASNFRILSSPPCHEGTRNSAHCAFMRMMCDTLLGRSIQICLRKQNHWCRQLLVDDPFCRMPCIVASGPTYLVK